MTLPLNKGGAPGSGIGLTRDADGNLRLIDGQGVGHGPVVPVRAFPIESPETHISIVDSDGREVAAIAALADLDPDSRAMIQQALASREFMPVIERIESVSRYVTPCTWTVSTDRGPTAFVLKSEEGIRRLPPARLLIADADGIQYLVPDTGKLDERSRKLLDRFM